MKQNKKLIKLLQDLIDVGTEKLGHKYDGLCPDRTEGSTNRDRTCPACKVLIRTEKLILEMQAGK